MLLFLLPVGLCSPLCFVGGGKGKVQNNTILELDLEQPVTEALSSTSLLSGASPLSSRDIVFALERAAKDDAVKGLFVRVGGAGHGLATAQEVRDALVAFKASGKPSLAYAESFGELSPGTGGYFIASALDEIVLVPTGNVSLAPLAAEGVFARDGLSKLGVEPQFAARKEYKNAPNTFLEQGFTAPHKEATLALLSSVQRQLAAGIAAGRPALGDAAAVEGLLLGGPYNDQAALGAKLVDRVGYRDEALAGLRSRVREKFALPAPTPASDAEKKDSDLPLLWLSKYLERAGSPYGDDVDGAVIAQVTGVGQIMRGTSNSDPFSGSSTIGSDTLAAALRAAVDDADVKAILLRVDSPGGSVVASELIAHEVERARAAKKPVIVSMANVAGSGGYYISMNADAIVAQPGTITGSIGVYAGKFVTTKAWEQLGISYETVTIGDSDSSFFSTDLPYSESARAKLDAMVDGIYQTFVQKVATGRKRSFAEIEPVARGRIWSGQDGKDRGLVDVLGGYPVALGLVREKLGLAKDAPLTVRDFPKAKTPAQELMGLFGPSRGENSDDGAASTTRPTAQAVAQALRAAMASEPAVVLMPPLSLLP